MNSPRLAVIGAGAAGLAVVREALRRDLSVVAFEQSEHLGGTWVYHGEPEDDPLGLQPSHRVHASLYPSLRTNLPRALMAFRDFAFDDPDPAAPADPFRAFPSHAAVRSYLERFARHFDLRSRVQFGCQVVSVQRSPRRERGFELAWRLGDVTHAEFFDAVAVCNGHYWSPRIGHLPGAERLAHQSLHSHNYRGPEAFRERRVLIVGAASSGVDLSLEIATRARETWLCSRSESRRVAPSGLGPRRPPVERLDARNWAQLRDGTGFGPVDRLVYCTGYDYRFPFLDQRFGIESGEHVAPLLLDLFWTEDPGLAFVGLPFRVIPFPQFELQARAVTMHVAGRLCLPPRAERRASHLRRQSEIRQAGVPRRHFLRYGERQFEYYAELAALPGADPLPAWFAELDRRASVARMRRPASYRDEAQFQSR